MSPGHTESTAPSVLIVGGGFIGKTLADAVIESGRSAVVVTRSPQWNGPETEVVVGDASDAEVMAPLVARVSHVMLAHSGLQPAESQQEPVRDLQAILAPIAALFTCLSSAPGVGVTHFSSGGTIYGDAEVVPTPESATLQPTSFYGTNRWVAERYLDRYATLSNPVTILRCANLYGRHQPAGRSQGLVAVVADKLRRAEPITIFGDGATERDYIFADDVGDVALSLVFDAPSSGRLRTFNCGSGIGTRTIDLVQRIADLLEVEPSLDRRPDRGFDVRRSILDISSLRSVVPFEPTSLDEGLRRTLANPG